MKPIEINPVTPVRPPGADASRAVSTSSPDAGSATASAAEPEMVTRSASLSAGTVPPVDADRVAQIRTAIKDGNYPLVPTSVADAMIAAGYLLIEGQKDAV